uniref:Si:ch211-214j8.1 n=1 Tax=Sinocyclocheilus anshuiensis TaxID=1608454 RepID=A0A671KF74_9TELE
IMLKEVLLSVLAGAVAFTVGILLGHFAIDKGSSVPDWVRDASHDVDECIIEKFLAELDTNQLRGNLRELTKVPHMATTPGDEDPNTGLDNAWKEDYKSIHNIFSFELVSKQLCGLLVLTRLFYMQGKLVYANQGKTSDYELLNRALDLRGTIAITRYGGEGRSKKAINAAKFGIVGLEAHTTLTLDTLPKYQQVRQTGILPIPAQPIGFEDAERLICNVHLDIYNTERLEYSANVMGVIRGSVEPGTWNHRDSWVHRAIAPSSGTAVMLEITRVLGKMVKEGKWQPRRSIIFGSWGAEEFGFIGSAEYTEEYFSKLSERTVANVNVDISVFANATLRASASPAAQCHFYSLQTGEEQVLYQLPYLRCDFHNALMSHVVGFLTGAGSDYAAFMHYLGITSMDISYYYDWSKTRARIYPAYYTAYDTFDYTTFHYVGFTSHQAVARTAWNVLLRLADSLLLPFNCSDYAESPEQYLSQAVTIFEEKLAAKGISIGDDVKITCCGVKGTKQHKHNFCLHNRPLKVRQINDQLMLLDRAFLDPLAFPEQYGFRHVIWSSSVPTFPGLADAVKKAESTGLKEDWDQAHKHISIVTQAIAGAAHTLDDVI